MNEIFSFHKELNIKKIVLLLLTILLLICGFTVFFIFFKKDINSTNDISSSTTSTFYDTEKKISLEFSKTYGFKQYNSKKNYLIELKNDNKLSIFVSSENIIENRPLSAIVSGDVKSYIEEFDAYSNVSGIREEKINNYNAYTYSFHYLDSKENTPYYLQVYWIETEEKYYIIDIEFPLDNLNNHLDLISDVLNNLIIY